MDSARGEKELVKENICEKGDSDKESLHPPFVVLCAENVENV